MVPSPTQNAVYRENAWRGSLQKESEEEKEELKFMSVSYRINDKVIQLVNRSEKGVMNGDIGIITNFKYKDFK